MKDIKSCGIKRVNIVSFHCLLRRRQRIQSSVKIVNFFFDAFLSFSVFFQLQFWLIEVQWPLLFLTFVMSLSLQVISLTLHRTSLDEWVSLQWDKRHEICAKSFGHEEVSESEVTSTRGYFKFTTSRWRWCSSVKDVSSHFTVEKCCQKRGRWWWHDSMTRKEVKVKKGHQKDHKNSKKVSLHVFRYSFVTK